MLSSQKMHQLTMMQDQVTNYLLDDKGMRTFASKLAEYTGGNIYIYNRFKDDLLYRDKALKDNKDFQDFLMKRELLRSEKAFLCCQHTIHENTYVWNDENGDEIKEKEIQLEMGNNESIGILAVKDYREMDQFEYRIMIIISHAVALKLHQNKLISEVHTKCSSELIEDLLFKRVDDKEELIERAGLVKWNLKLNYQIYIFDVIEDENSAERDAYYLYEAKERIMQLIRSYIKRNFNKEHFLFSYQDNIILFLNYENKAERDKKDINSILEYVSEALQSYYINIGAGSFIYDPLEISESYQEAMHVLDFLRSTEKKDSIYFYSNLGLMRLLWNTDQEELEEFSREYLSGLIEYDSGNTTEWLDTLGIYLEEGGSIQKAAERLFIHPNTMSYRVKRIKEILDIDLQNQEVQLNLSAAYKIYKYILNDSLEI